MFVLQTAHDIAPCVSPKTVSSLRHDLLAVFSFVTEHEADMIALGREHSVDTAACTSTLKALLRKISPQSTA
jgi:septum formation topological specificity factor MinE